MKTLIEQKELTKRERQILLLIAEGNTSAEIATKLDLSQRTVEGHRAVIKSKLDLKNTADITRYAMQMAQGQHNPKLLPDGVYFNTASWEFLDVPGDNLKIEANQAGRLIRVPTLTPLILGPFAGLAFVIFVPLIGVISAVGFTWQRLARALHIGHYRLGAQHR